MYITKNISLSPVAWSGKVPTLDRSVNESVSAFQVLFQERVKPPELSCNLLKQDSFHPEKCEILPQKTRMDKSYKKVAGLHLIKGTRQLL